MVVDDLLVVLAVGKYTEELLQVDIVDITGTYPAPGTEVNIQTRCAGTAAQLGDTLQVTGVALLEVEDFASTLVHHLNTDIALTAEPAFVPHLLTFGIHVGRGEFYLMEDVLLYIVPGFFVLIEPLVRHVDMKEGFAGGLQLAILLGTYTQFFKGNLEIKQIAA